MIFFLLSQSVYPPLLLPFFIAPYDYPHPLSLYKNDLYHFVAFYGISKKKNDYSYQKNMNNKYQTVILLIIRMIENIKNPDFSSF